MKIYLWLCRYSIPDVKMKLYLSLSIVVQLWEKKENVYCCTLYIIFATFITTY